MPQIANYSTRECSEFAYPSEIIKSRVHRHAMIAMYAVINFNYDQCLLVVLAATARDDLDRWSGRHHWKCPRTRSTDDRCTYSLFI